jgi:hypothetical protein
MACRTTAFAGNAWLAAGVAPRVMATKKKKSIGRKRLAADNTKGASGGRRNAY